MIALIIIITVVVVTLYVLTGRKLAIRNLPRAWKIGRRERSAKKYVRTSVRCQTVCMFFFWPYYGSFILLAAHLDKVIDAGDPKALRDKLAKLEQRNAELERELGMTP